jgi:RNA polymerase sigma factor (sigma-70 family)
LVHTYQETAAMKHRFTTWAAVAIASLLGATVTTHSENFPPSPPGEHASSTPDRHNFYDAFVQLRRGKKTFRYDTFGDEAFWGDALRLHEAIAGEANGGIGSGVSPKMALALGLKVDVDALPHKLRRDLRERRVNLDDPATTLALLKLDAVVGLRGFFDQAGHLQSVGITCALCHLLAYGGFASFRHDAKLSTWLVRIVANVAVGRLRKNVHRSELFARQYNTQQQVQSLDQDSPERPDEALSRADTRRLLETKIDSLPDPYCVVFVLRAVQELSFTEISAGLGIPEATVRSRYSRARSLLRKSLSTEVDAVLRDAFPFAEVRCDRVVEFVMKAIESAEG